MFNHPEGEVHPKAPTHRKRVKDYDFGHELFGLSEQLIENFLAQESVLECNPYRCVSQQIRDFVYLKEQRASYVKFAYDYLRQKKINKKNIYDIIIVGAGVHSALFSYNVLKENPDFKILILEKSNEISSTFAKLGDSLVLNSPTFSKVGLNANIMPGHFIQTSDFDELQERPFPTAKHIHEIATMILFHSDVDVIFETEVKNIDTKKENYQIQIGNKRVYGKNIIISNGMGDPNPEFLNIKNDTPFIYSGDEFISKSYKDKDFFDSIKNKKIAVVGDGDTANCVMEYILPLVYPNFYYGFYRESKFSPQFVYWIGQSAKNIQDFYFQNKTRYCHSGGVIEFFWHEDTPFELSTEVWKHTKDLIQCIPEKLSLVKNIDDRLKLSVNNKEIEVDIMIDCTGRYNEFSNSILKKEKEFIKEDISFFGGFWCEKYDRFVTSEKTVLNKKVACKIKNENIFLIGSAAPLESMIEADEARDGSSKYSTERKTLTNSKWSLEHTIPRTISFAKICLNLFKS